MVSGGTFEAKYGAFGVTASAIAPRFIETAMTKAHPRLFRRRGIRQVTGQLIYVDGGRGLL